MANKSIPPSVPEGPAAEAAVNGDAASSRISEKPEGDELEGSSKSCTLGDVDTISANRVEGPSEANTSNPSAPKPSSPWVGLFKDSKVKQAHGFSLPKFEFSEEMLVVDPIELDNVERSFGHCLVGYFAGKFPGKQALLKICNSWGVSYQYFPHSSGWLIFKFGDAASRDQVLRGGPYFAYGRPLFLKVMPSCFEFNETLDVHLPLWVRFPGLPVDFWNPTLLGRIASRLGVPIASDRNTATKEKLSFARALVEVDVSKDLVREITIMMPCGKLRHQHVIYEYEPQFCPTCMAFGHIRELCKAKKPKLIPSEAPTLVPQDAPEAGEGSSDPISQQQPDPTSQHQPNPPEKDKEQASGKCRDEALEITPNKGQPEATEADDDGDYEQVVSKRKKKSEKSKAAKLKKKIDPLPKVKDKSESSHNRSEDNASKIPNEANPPQSRPSEKVSKASKDSDSRLAKIPAQPHDLRKKGPALRIPPS